MTTRVYAAPIQKAVRIAKLLAEEIVPKFGVPEALQDVCKLFNITVHHLQCNGGRI